MTALKPAMLLITRCPALQLPMAVSRLRGQLIRATVLLEVGACTT